MSRLAALALVLAIVGVVAAGSGGATSEQSPGTCRAHLIGDGPALASDTWGLSTAMPDGSLVVGVAYRKRKEVIVNLGHVLPGCRVAASVRVVVPLDSGDGDINSITATPDGRILLAGGAGLEERALVGRFFPNGGLDRSFGHGGWIRFLPTRGRCETARFADVSSLAVEPSGTIVLGGITASDDCDREFVSELTPNGRLIRTFGREGSVIVPSIDRDNPTHVSVSVDPDRSVYALGDYTTASGQRPRVVRIFTDGSLDSRFDAAMTRTIRRVARPHEQVDLIPSLVPDGNDGFTLVGGLDWYGVPARFTGVSVRVAPSGRITGSVTHFRSPWGAFDGSGPVIEPVGPAALRLPSGRTLVAGYGMTRAYIQVFGPDGSRDPAVGHRGLLHFPNPPGVQLMSKPPIGLVASGGGALLVRGYPREIDLTPVPVR